MGGIINAKPYTPECSQKDNVAKIIYNKDKSVICKTVFTFSRNFFGGLRFYVYVFTCIVTISMNLK